MNERSICRTVTHIVHCDLVFSVSLKTTFCHFISKGKGVAIYATAVFSKTHQHYVEGELDAGQSRIQISDVPALILSPLCHYNKFFNFII